MKKVLILAYYYPPCNMPGANRPYGWAKYLSENDYYPIVITRSWNIEIKNPADILRNSGNEVVHEIHDTHEVYFLPYKQNFRDKLYTKHGEKKYSVIRKLMTFYELLFQNYFNTVISYKNLYYFTSDFLKKNPDISLLITTGAPYVLFKFAYLLKKKHKISWIADYRDDWNTSEFSFKLNRTNFLLQKIEARSERKWVGSAVFHTAVSPYSVEKNSKYLNKKGFTIHNGYMPEDFYSKEKTDSYNKFTISFIGTLYPTQNIELFLNAFKEFINQNLEKNDILLLFPGLAYDIGESKRVMDCLKGYEKFYLITERVPKSEIIQIELKTDAFLYCAHDVKGVIGSKIYEYVGLGKPVIFCPSDKDTIEDIFKKSGVGYICNFEVEVLKSLKELYHNYLRNDKKIVITTNKQIIDYYSRQSQTKELANVLDKVIEQNNLIDDKITTFRSDAFQLLNNIGYNNLVTKIKHSSNRVSVLCFHGVSPHKNFSYPPIHPRQFEKIIYYLSKTFHITTFEEIKHIKKTTKPICALTFDDGYKDFIEYALPVLAKYHLPAVQNIVVDSAETGKPFWTQRLNNITNFLHEKKSDFLYTFKGESFLYTNNSFNSFYMKLFSFLLESHSDIKNYILTEIEDMFFDKNYYKIEMMSWNDIKQCTDNNISIGSHSMTHDTLSTINNDELLINEIVRSKNIITDKINRSVTSFAFPNGYYNEKVLEIAEKNYDYLLCTNEKTVKRSVFNSTPVIIPRISVDKQSYCENIAKINNFHTIFKKNER